MYIKFFNENQTTVMLEKAPEIIDNRILFYQQEEAIPALEDGFELVLDNKNYIIFSSDNVIYSVYYIYDEETGFVYTLTSTPFESIDKTNMFFVRKGIGPLYESISPEEIFDENNLPKFKIINNQIVETTEEEKAVLLLKRIQKLKEEKIKELSNICENNIVNGIEYNGEHFAYELADQNNLYNSVQLSLGTNLPVPYHATGNLCRLYSTEELVAIYAAQETNLTHNMTYYNQLKHYVEELMTEDEIKAIYYGQELTGEYLDNYNAMMNQANIILQTFLGANQIGE